MKFISLEQLHRDGILHEVNRTFFHPIGMALSIDGDTGVLSVEDHTDDMEGMAFSDGALSREKFEAFVDFAHPRIRARLAGVGFVEQPIPGSLPAREACSDSQNGKPNLRLVKHRVQPVPDDPEGSDGHGSAA